MGKHAEPAAFAGYLEPLRHGESIGVISEAGCPAVADPGAALVEIAQREGLKVVPLVGPSSILLSVMASGFNGQSFAFHGYLPIDGGERAKALKRYEARSAACGCGITLFVETSSLVISSFNAPRINGSTFNFMVTWSYIFVLLISPIIP